MSRGKNALLLTPSEQLRYNRLGARLRIIAGLTGIAFTGVVTASNHYPEFPAVETLLLSGFVLAYNAFGVVALRQAARAHDVRASLMPVQRVLTVLDQLTLTSGLYVFGGLELFVFPVILLAMFMVAINNGKRESYIFFGTNLLLVTAFFVLQHFGVIPYRPAIPMAWVGIELPRQNPIASSWPALFSTVLILGFLLFAVIYFSNFVKDKFQRLLAEYVSGKKEITSLRRLSASILDIFPFALVIIDPEHGTVEAANPAAAGLLGAHPGWLGRSIHRIADLEEAGLTPYIERVLEGERLRLTSFPLVRPGQEKRYLSINAFSGDMAGASNKILFCAEDITEQLERENEQRDMQQALLQTEKLASLGQMAAGIAHELNNPLSAIDAYGQLLAHRVRTGAPVGEESLERIERISENADRIRMLVRNLLSYARPSPETPVELSVPTVVNESLKLFEHEIRRRKVELRLDLAEDLPRVTGNKTQLQQVLINLVTNAAHACAPQDGRIGISVRADGDRAVEMTVEDNGDGIDSTLLEKIFEPFFSTKAPGEGTGLGLAIVMAIIESHNGRIQVDSRPGEGTRFIVRLPCAMVEKRPPGDIEASSL